MHSAVGSYAVALWWGCKLSSVLPGERFPDRWGCMLSSLYYQERKIPRQVGLHAELIVLVN